MTAQDEARLLRAAVAKGWLADGDLAAPEADAPAGRFGPRVQRLLDSGRLDRIALAALAEELGLGSGVDDRSTLGQGEARGAEPPRGWDRYQRLERLGGGGGGEVFRAHDPRLQRDVALKFLSQGSSERIERFRREAQAQARVEHEHVCKVYEVGDAGGKLYIAMQYLAGGTLAAAAPGLSIEAKVRLIRQVALAVHAAHRLGIVHRDLKPSNVMLERGEDGELQPYVVDFGLARELEGGATLSGVAGTPGYMAPEQARGDGTPSDRRTDVYGLGAMLYSVLAGQPPFQGALADVLAQVLEREPPRLRQLRPELPRDLETICARCLEKAPEKRYDSARALADELGRFLDGEPILARPRSLAVRLLGRIRRHKLLAGVLAAGVLAAALLGGLWLRSESRGRERARLAQRFGQDARGLESIMRYAHLLPLHDIRREQALVRRQMDRVRADMAKLGALAAGPGNHALGRGFLALHDPAQARAALERAWASGAREPDVAYALGQAYGELYQHRLADLARIEDREIRAARRRELAAELRDPAVRYLRLSRGSATDSPAYLEAQLALYEERFPEALAQAARARSEVPWLYEASLLEGQVYLAMMRAAHQAGRNKEVRELAQRARQALQAAEELARSDDAVTGAACQGEAGRFAAMTRLGKVSEADLDAALAPCQRALQANPDRVDSILDQATIWTRRAENQVFKGQDPHTAVMRATELAEQALAGSRGDHRALAGVGAAQRVLATWELETGGDPGPALARAIASLEQARAVRAEPQVLIDLGRAYIAAAGSRMAAGEPWQPQFDAALASFRRASELGPQLIAGLLAEGEAEEDIAGRERAAGRDPRPWLERALAAYQRALAINPQSAHALADRGSAEMEQALYLVDQGRDDTAAAERARASFQAAAGAPGDLDAYYLAASRLGEYARVLMGRATDPSPFLDPALAAMAEARRLEDGDPHDDLITAELLIIRARHAHNSGALPASEQALAEARVVLARAIAELPESDALNSGVKLEYWTAHWRIGGEAGARAAVQRGLALSERAFARGGYLGYSYQMRGWIKNAAAELATGRARAELQADAERDLALAASAGHRP